MKGGKAVVVVVVVVTTVVCVAGEKDSCPTARVCGVGCSGRHSVSSGEAMVVASVLIAAPLSTARVAPQGQAVELSFDKFVLRQRRRANREVRVTRVLREGSQVHKREQQSAIVVDVACLCLTEQEMDSSSAAAR